ncbi:MAG: CHAT domain-containing protein [Cyanobacteria bacterium P01_F01_bin.13]
MGHLEWKHLNSRVLQIASWLGVFTLGISPTWGQVTPTGNTTATADGFQIQITGGDQSADGANLFHQFELFNVDTSETVTFVAPDSVENILGRVTSLQPSTIDGGLAVSNSANLWLLNPAGLFFGPNSHLNLQGDFTAATADAIGFDQGWFIDGAKHQALVGPPKSFAFIYNSGHLINLGNLEVAPGQNLRLLGGSVVNTGSLSAPDGSITVAAVANGNRVNLSQTGQLLALEIEPWSDPETFLDITQLPALLTGQGADHANTLEIATDGTIQLAQSVPDLAPAGAANISGTVQTTGDYGGQIAILGDQVSLIDADINADGIHQGGYIAIGGSYQGSGPLPNATHTRVDQNTQLSANALAHGNGGEIIVWADQATSFSGNVQAQGGEFGGNGGFIEISGKSKLGFTGQFSVSAPQGEFGSILFDPDNIEIVDGIGAANGDVEIVLPQFGTVLAEDGDNGWFTIHEATLELWNGNANIFLQANNDIIVRNLGGDNALTFRSGTGSISFIADADNDGAGQFLMDHAGDLIDTAGRDITISGYEIDIQLLDTRSNIETGGAGDVNLLAQDIIRVQGTLNADNISLQGDAISLEGGDDSISGNTLSLQPWSPDQNIDVGANASSGALNLLESDILAIKDGFTNISIGRADGTGNVILYDAVADGGAAAFSDPITILGAQELRGPEQVTTWTITGNNQGNLNSLFSNGLTFENVTSIAASSNTSDILQGTEGNDTITLTRENGGTFKGINFEGIHNIRGAGGDDSIIFANGVAALSGFIDGGAGDNTLDYRNYIENVVFNLETGDVSGTEGFSNIQKVIGGLIRADIVRGTSGNDVVTLTGDGAGTINEVAFEGFSRVMPGGGDDRILVNGGTWSSIDGGAGTDTLDYGSNAATTGVTIDLTNQTADNVTAFSNIEDFKGSSGADTLRGTDGDDEIAITADNTGTLGTTTFSSIENINAGAGNDQVAILPNGSLSGNLAGGAGVDSLDYSAYTTNVAINLAYNTATAIGGFTNFEQITGGSGNSDRISATDGNDDIILGGVDKGIINTVIFNNIESVLGQAGDDRFVFDDGAQVSGTLDGGTGTDGLDYDNYTSDVAINLQTSISTGNQGINNFESLIGGSANDTLTGTNANDTITFTGVNAGSINALSFNNIENYDGGTGDDVFTLNNGASVTGELTGGDGFDTANYSNYTTGITVDLQTNSATGTGGFNTLESFVGGSNNDTFRLRETNPISTIDGGTGSDTLEGDTVAGIWNLTALNTGNGTGVSNFSNIENLIAGNQTEQINFLADGAQFTGVLDGSDGVLTLSGDTISLGTAVKGMDELIIRPLSPNRDIQIGGSSLTPALNISTPGLSNINNSFTAITIGHPEGTGKITLGSDAMLPASTTIQSPNGDGSINTQGFDLSAPELTLIAAQEITTANLTAISGVTLIGGDMIDTQDIFTSQNLDGGDVAVKSDNTITIQQIDTESLSGMGGDVTLTAIGDVEIGPIRTVGNIAGGSVVANVGNLMVQQIDTTGLSGTGGNITLITVDDIGVGDLQAEGNTAGGNIVTDSDILTAQEISTTALSGNGGKITVIADDINVGDLRTNGNINGGNLTIREADTITTQQIITTGLNGIGGDVTLSSVEDIAVESIRAEGNTAGGNVDITTNEFFRATDNFVALNGNAASISTAAFNGTGSITIRHAGNGATPFNVGDGNLLGSHAALISGDSSVDPSNSFLNSYTLGNIAILTQDIAPPPIVELPVVPPPIVELPVVEAPVNLPVVEPSFVESPNVTIPAPTNTSENASATDFNSPLVSNRSLALEDLSESVESNDSNKALFERLENSYSEQFKSHLNLYERVNVSPTNLATAQQTLGNVEALTGVKPGVLYVYFLPAINKDSAVPSSNGLNPNDELGVLLLTHDGQTIRRKIEGVTRRDVMTVAEDFFNQVTNVISSPSQYLPPAKQLYEWFITPIEEDLQQQGVQSLALAMDTGLRTLPIAALHNGEEFLIERYSLGVIPSFSLTDFNSENFLYTQLENTQLLAMGASQFPSQQVLPAVPEELNIVTKAFHDSAIFLNEGFTLSNLQTQVARNEFGIVHLASHGVFEPGEPRESYIQLWDQPLRLDQVHTLGLQDADIALMVLSACNTALGDREAEYGFAGLAVNAGVQTSIASLWPISDEGTLGLMTYFYEYLQQQPVRATALRQAQLAMLQGELQFADGTLSGPNEKTLAHFPELEHHGRWNFQHPFYWSTYTLVGSPW